MSYSFNIRASSPAEALELIRAQLDKAVELQPTHKLDRDQAEAVATAYVALLPEVPAGKQLAVSVAGYLSGTWHTRELLDVTGASVSVSAALVPAI